MAEPMKRTILERFDVPDSNYETVIMHVEIAPLANTGLHTHPGFDAAYLLDGDLTVLERGQPAKPRSVRMRRSFRSRLRSTSAGVRGVSENP